MRAAPAIVGRLELMGGLGRLRGLGGLGQVRVRAAPAIMGRVGRVGVRAAPAIVGQVGQVGWVGHCAKKTLLKSYS